MKSEKIIKEWQRKSPINQKRGKRCRFNEGVRLINWTSQYITKIKLTVYRRIFLLKFPICNRWNVTRYYLAFIVYTMSVTSVIFFPRSIKISRVESYSSIQQSSLAEDWSLWELANVNYKLKISRFLLKSIHLLIKKKKKKEWVNYQNIRWKKWQNGMEKRKRVFGSWFTIWCTTWPITDTR